MDVPQAMETDEERAFWLAATQSALDKIWSSSEDDIYEELLLDQR
ncbi:MAG TPA: hypothetical protein VF092_14935 [Longimicrobium sp.]